MVEQRKRVARGSRRASKRCRTCAARILWCVTESGRPMPVDFEPSDEGNIAITPQDDGTWLAVVAGPLEQVEGASRIRRTSHFATCPNAAQHRRR